MSAAVPTIRPIPADVTHERRELDRHQPAAELTVREPGHTTYWVRAGRGEVLAADADDQARRIYLHNLINGHTTIKDARLGLRDPERQS